MNEENRGLNCYKNLSLEHKEGNIYMFILVDNSELINKFENKYKSNKIIDIEFYGKCKEICEDESIENLKHAKAVLEERKIDASGNDVGFAQIFAIASMTLAILSLLADSIVKILGLDSSCDFFVSTCIVFVIVTFILLVVYMGTIPSRRRHAYYYSVICDEIDEKKKNETKRNDGKKEKDEEKVASISSKCDKLSQPAEL